MISVNKMLSTVSITLSMLYLGLVDSHSNMLSPKPRGNLKWWGYCSRGQGCKTTCDAPLKDSKFNEPWFEKKVVRRGDIIDVSWLRQNHPGGFVRLAIVPMALSDNSTLFDHSVYKYACYETNCKEDHYDNFLGPNNGPGFAKCSTQMKIPSNLPDGPITLQWTWFGGGVYYGDNKASFANYVSCSDMMLQGGVPLIKNKPKPVFKGGDAATPHKNQCRYWSTNTVWGCPIGGEDYNRQGCGHSDEKYGAPKGYSY